MGSVRCDLGVAAVVTKNSKVLLVKEASGRYSGHWGLPKGYVDEGELPRDAALRELREECSVDGVATGIYAVRENLTDIGPAIFIAYDSRKDKINKIATLFKHITCPGITPEGLCFEAIQKEIVDGSGDMDSYFINFSDGAPYFENKDLQDFLYMPDDRCYLQR